jgi:putative phage-type endonuclease
MLTEEQIEQRLSYVTGSDAGVICGVNPYMSAVELWQYKTRRAVPKDISDKPAVKAGNMLEEAVAQWFESVTEHIVGKKYEFVTHPTHKFLGGNPDFMLAKGNGLLECKTTQSDKGWGLGFEHGDNVIPDHYLCQVIHYCAVTGCDTAYIAVLIRGIDFRWFKYERNMALEQKVIDKEIDFWVNHVLADRCPTAVTADDVKVMLRGEVSDEAIVADRDISEALATLRETRQIIKGLEATEKSLQDLICVYMNDKQTLVEANGKIAATWKQRNGSARFDAKSFQQDHAELYDRYLSVGAPVRSFLLK